MTGAEHMTSLRLHDLLARAAARHGDRPALTDDDVTLTYAQLWDRVEGFGLALSATGLRRGERVAVLLEKRVETVVACLGVSVADGVLVPVNPLLRPRQVAHVVADCEPSAIVTTPERYALHREALSGLQAIIVGDSAPEGGPDGAGTVAWEDLVGGTAIDPVGRVDSDPAAIFYTSGSTGRPKGVVVSHRNLIVGGESVASYLGNGPDDRILAVLPLSFDAGFSQLTTGFTAGAHVFLVNYLLPGDVVRICAERQITGLTCVPPLWAQLVRQSWPSEATSSLRYFASTGGKVPASLLGRLRETFPDADPYLMYGLTEAFRSTFLPPAELDRRPGSIGQAIPNADVSVLRPDGTECDAGEHGELVHRGPLVALGYWNDERATAQRFRPVPSRAPGCRPDVAVWSGDIVVRDEDGYLYFVGRQDEMIKTSGYRVSPTEVEEAALDSGLVEEAVAFGEEDDVLGQRIVLVVGAGDRPLPDAAEVQAALREVLPLYMVPSRVVVAERLPRSPNGKLDRATLRDEV